MIPKHVGIVPDGNRRYARSVGLSKADAYQLAAHKAVEVIGWCLDLGVEHVSAFGVSQENIALRPPDEVEVLHGALLRFCEDVSLLPDVRLHLFGDLDGSPRDITASPRLLALSERTDTGPARLVVHVGVNYSALAEVGQVLRAVRSHGAEVVALNPAGHLLSAGVPAVDLVVRSGGQQRLSGFLPFQTAYAELWFTETLWPEIGRPEFERAVAWYGRQERRMGE
jgi:short-chain Z-isoprenyl diphosphate synthase